jgi:5-keto 4-deoxyuronate isomerase
MIENLACLAIGFATTFLALETAWHFTACKIKDKRMKPYFYKQIGLLK